MKSVLITAGCIASLAMSGTALFLQLRGDRTMTPPPQATATPAQSANPYADAYIDLVESKAKDEQAQHEVVQDRRITDAHARIDRVNDQLQNLCLASGGKLCP